MKRRASFIYSALRTVQHPFANPPNLVPRPRHQVLGLAAGAPHRVRCAATTARLRPTANRHPASCRRSHSRGVRLRSAPPAALHSEEHARALIRVRVRVGVGLGLGLGLFAALLACRHLDHELRRRLGRGLAPGKGWG